MATWRLPSGMIGGLSLDMLAQPHLLIAGATGSGKSVLINTLIYTATFKSPDEVNFILIDPKCTELHMYKKLPHTIRYACETYDVPSALRYAIDIIDKRKHIMQRKELRNWPKELGPDVYAIIDEFADLVTMPGGKKVIKPLVQRIAQLGRAMKVHLILATQRPTRDIIDGAIKVNLDSRVALRCPTSVDSRNILDVKGAEKLPRYGKGLYLTPSKTEPSLIDIMMTDEQKLRHRIDFWAAQNKVGFFGRRR